MKLNHIHLTLGEDQELSTLPCWHPKVETILGPHFFRHAEDDFHLVVIGLQKYSNNTKQE